MIATLRQPSARIQALAVLSIGWTFLFNPGWAQAKPKLTVSKALWSDGSLTISGSYRNGSSSAVELYDGSGRHLGSAALDERHRFSFSAADARPELLCSVRAEADSVAVIKTVKGNGKDCAKAPSCRILVPAQAVAVGLEQPLDLRGVAQLKDRKAAPLTVEWDFGGGAMGMETGKTVPPGYSRLNATTGRGKPLKSAAQVKFVRDKSSYRVRFTAWDRRNRYCEDSVTVAVGEQPATLPDVESLVQSAQQHAPPIAGQAGGTPNAVVVLPYEDWTMQARADSRFTPAGQAVMDPTQNNLNAVAYRKDRKPVLLTGAELTLKYSAASNAVDPVAPDSITTTSQNWPLAGDKNVATPLMAATVQKTDIWETSGTDGYKTFAGLDNWYVINDPALGAIPDQAFPIRLEVAHLSSWPKLLADGGFTYADPEHGSRMPGFADPYKANDPQDFTTYLDDPGGFLARMIPITDVDDQDRINPFPLLRVQAADAKTGEPVAATDAVLTAGKDVHCRECHAKGGIAADDNAPWTDAAWHYSTPNWDGTFGGAAEWWDGGATKPAKPVFVAAESASLFDQEFAAAMNTAILHDYYDNTGLVHNQDAGKSVQLCSACHKSRLTGWVFGGNDEMPNSEGIGLTPDKAGPLDPDGYFNPDYSRAMHKWHGELQYNADRTAVLRDANGIPKRWNAADGPNPNSLFPTVDAKGKPLPMEQNCLRCHSGHREQLYRDRMYTAGVTCYQCHGDLLAVGKAWPKSRVNPDGLQFRTDWYDQPDCGSCHVGNGNVGKADADFFSAGVKQLAFDPTDHSATPSPVDLSNPDAVRFAVVPYTDLEFAASYAAGGSKADSLWVGGGGATETIRTPLYRNGKDPHGDVPCAACHGGAHAVWPNRDPKANDNVTALQLQGHAGNVDECKVCHTADAFKNLADLDGGRFRTDLPTDSGVLGGPHNLHPVYDEYWWKAADGDTENKDGTSAGGWHNDYAKKPGKAGEDQCAACHGNDHNGTRLSKTPVDRVFDFSGMDRAALTKAGFKSLVIRVPAGTPIGCNTCHDIKTSCLGSPAGEGVCGKPSAKTVETTNRPPVLHVTPDTTGIIGEPNSYTMHATDPDGDPVTYSVSRRPDDMEVDPATGGITTSWPGALFYDPWTSGNPSPVLTYPYVVTASDGKGGYVTQRVTVSLRCPDNHLWSGSDCSGISTGGLTITSKPETVGMNAGDAFSYQVTATSANGGTPSFALSGQPTGMTIDSASGLLSWLTGTSSPDKVSFQIQVTDGKGGSASQTVRFEICKPPKAWDSGMVMCM